MSNDTWTVTESGWDPARANYHETIFTVGNGRLGTRGSLEEGHTGALSGTYLAGVYDAHDAPVIDLVNAPDWLDTEVYADAFRLDADSLEVSEHSRTLNLRTGVLTRDTVFTDPSGRRTRLVTRRLASMADRDLCALRIEVTPLDAAATITVATGIDGHRRNLERLPAYPEGIEFEYDRKWDKWARSTHLRTQARGFDGTVGYLVTRTIASEHDIAYACEVTCSLRPQSRRQVQHRDAIGEQLTFAVAQGETVTLDKTVGVATSRDPGGGPDVRARAVRTVAEHVDAGFSGIEAASARAWEKLWASADCEIVGDDKAARALRFSVYHLLIAANPDDPTVNIGAKSLSGEGYRGHVFWDTEIMMLPFFTYTQPRTARALLGYRHHTLPGAREVSAENGTGGARFPWESADTGLEECPRFTPDGQNRFYTRDEEVHVSGDVAYGIMAYVDVTGDDDFLYGEGAEVLFETSRFWVDRMEADGDKLVLKTVMGPDEFHSHVDNNAFTNYLVRWHLQRAADVYASMATGRAEQLAALSERIGLSADEPERWIDAANRLVQQEIPEAGPIEQFDGYFELKDVPIEEWDENNMPRYPKGYHHFNCEDTMLLKQPDSVMLVYMFPDDFSHEQRAANYSFYEARTLHKSSLSPSIHAIVGLQIGDSSMAEQYFARSAYVDLDDNQGNTEEGMHIASAGGTWQTTVHGFGGFRLSHGKLHFDPELPESWERLRFSVQRHGRMVRADLGHEDARFELVGPADAEESIVVDGQDVLLRTGTPVSLQRAVKTAS